MHDLCPACLRQLEKNAVDAVGRVDHGHIAHRLAHRLTAVVVGEQRLGRLKKRLAVAVALVQDDRRTAMLQNRGIALLMVIRHVR